MSPLKNKKILVTGGSGFIGSHLTRRLVGEGAEVAVVTKYNSVIDNVRIADIWDSVVVIEADLRNADSLAQIRGFAPQIIFHFAAYNHVGDSFTHVAEALDCNVKGTANLIESYDGYERFVYISSSEVYGYQQEVPFTETMYPRPVSPYSVGKYGGELYCRMKMENMGRPVVILRPFNAFGPYQSPRAVIAEMVLTCLKGKPVISTKGEQTRDFNYVGDLVEGFIRAAHVENAIGQIINIGSGEEITIRDLILRIHRETASVSDLKIGDLPYRPTEIWRMFSDSRKARDILGWEPKTGFSRGLRRTIEWYRMFLEQYGPGDSRMAALGAFPLSEKV